MLSASAALTIPSQQEPVARFLTGLAGSAPKETHISAVFVGQDTVWKLKKAVRLPFLDFTTLAAREHFLRRELELNQPTAPGIYRDVIAVGRQPDGSWALGEGDVQDWVLRMARIPGEDFLDAVADRHALTPRMQDALGDRVVSDHAMRPVVKGWNSVAALQRVTSGNADTAQQAGLPIDTVSEWRQLAMAAIVSLGAWLTDRAASGFVRRCHGDLHLGNICLWNGEPVLFDALEFDEAMATTDTAYDLAFLLMDLDFRVGRAAANRVMNRMIARGGDGGMTRGLALFLSERAMIRAHVSAASGHAQIASAYLMAAQNYLSPAPGFMLAIGGLQGTGKSTLARLLGPALGAAPGAVVLRSDEIRKRIHGVAPEQRLPLSAYTKDTNQIVNASLIAQAQEIVQGGHSVVLDATFLDERMRQDVEAVAGGASVPFLGVWLQAPLAELERRIKNRHDDASDATLEVLHRSAASALSKNNWLQIDAMDGNTASASIRSAIDALISPAA